MKIAKQSLIAVAAIALAAFAVACSPENVPGTSPIPEDAIDLNASGASANCYIVPCGSTAVFSAAYKGNSTTEAIGEVSSARLVWQEAPALLTELYYVAETKQVVLTTSETAGNALVAVEDADGNILWSWHIWVADYDPEASLWTTPDSIEGQWSFMDRNLGASSADPTDVGSRGLLYQWGRKDPFTSAVAYTEQDADYNYITDGERTVYDFEGNAISSKPYETAEGRGSFEKSVLHPDIFYKIISEDGVEVYASRDWKDVSDDDSWGGVSFSKTINDPCPPGYKVPVFDEAGNSPFAWKDYAAMTWDSENGGAVEDGQWWPAAGTRVNYSGGLDLTEASKYGGMWIGTAGEASSDLVTYPTLYGQYSFIMNSRRMYTRVQKDSRAQCLSVRCVTE